MKIEDIKSELNNKVSKLTNFQEATVDKILDVFKYRNQALVADEVGLGKTLVASGIIAKNLLKVIDHRHESNAKQFYKVVYICSNQSIAGQNLRKLNVTKEKDFKGEISVSESRLSMQHLNVTIQEHEDAVNNRLLRLIPLTPQTSFNSNSGGGLKEERALIYIVLEESGLFSDCKDALSRYMRYGVGNGKEGNDSWHNTISKIRERVFKAQEYTNNTYLSQIVDSVINFPRTSGISEINGSVVLNDLKLDLQEEKPLRQYELIGKLRSIFSYISTEMLHPDLVIMDEFQSFRDLVTVPDDQIREMDNKDVSLTREENSNSLIVAGQYSDMVYLARRFLAHPDTNTLLLSATPFKMYATTEEIVADSNDTPYEDFIGVLKFLFQKGCLDKNSISITEFKEIWHKYTKILYASDSVDEKLLQQKEIAEKCLYSAIARTERNIVSDDYIETYKLPESLDVDFLNVNDLKSYLVMYEMYKNIFQNNNNTLSRSFYIEYAKSSPYLMSFMKHYVVKKDIVEFYRNALDKTKAELYPAWMDWNEIDQYQKIEFCNPKLRVLRDVSMCTNKRQSLDSKKGFQNNKCDSLDGKSGAEYLLWIPPSLPYYDLEGVFIGTEDFSKTIAFSSWEMVPRMTSTLLSYEAERKIMSAAFERQGKYLHNQKGNEIHYFKRNNTEKRYPASRLKFASKSETFFAWLYPSPTLSRLYNPENEFFSGRNLKGKLKNRRFVPGIEDIVLGELLKLISRYKSLDVIIKQTVKLLRRGYSNSRESWNHGYWKKWKKKLGENSNKSTNGNAGAAWYYLLPMLLDKDMALNWIDTCLTYYSAADRTSMKTAKFNALKEKLCNINEENILTKLGNPPEDLLFVLRDIVIASPAVCCYRSNSGNMLYSTLEAEIFADYFNLPENTAAIMALFNDKSVEEDDENVAGEETLNAVKANVGWKNTITYCKQGCFQAMIDEYRHLLKGELSYDEESELYAAMMNSMKIHGATYDIDFVDCLKSDGEYSGDDNDECVSCNLHPVASMRSHYAVSFSKGNGNEDKAINRRESVRSSFNSPLRPFVLTSTSVGQEGLDFHNYCMQIVHWNIPSNPIDMEQREGRINRFKCLAIRKSLANIFNKRTVKENRGVLKEYSGKDIWDRLFSWAKDEAKKKYGDNCCDLIPYWSIGDMDVENQIKIKRIVPLFPLSEDEKCFDKLVDALTTYRMTIGQARQEELLEHFNKKDISVEDKKKLFINLCPFIRKRKNTI